MKKKLGFKKALLLSSSVIFGTGVLATTCISLASFESYIQIDQSIRGGGRLGTFIYLNPSMWDKDGAVFGLYVWNPSDDTKYLWVKSIKITEDNYYVFEVADISTYSSMLFARLKPSTAEGYNSENNGYNFANAWNQTHNTSYDSSKKLYTIEYWEYYKDGYTHSYGSWSAYTS